MCSILSIGSPVASHVEWTHQGSYGASIGTRVCGGGFSSSQSSSTRERVLQKKKRMAHPSNQSHNMMKEHMSD